MHTEKSFLVGTERRLVHYIERMAETGHSMDKIREKLARGHSEAEVEKAVRYYFDHKASIYHHSPGVIAAAMLSGAVLFSLILYVLLSLF